MKGVLSDLYRNHSHHLFQSTSLTGDDQRVAYLSVSAHQLDRQVLLKSGERSDSAGLDAHARELR
jgi:hypothetical protein